MVDAKDLVDAWASAWPGGTSVAVVSALDVLIGDVLEDEGTRPETPLVTFENGVARVDADAIAQWTLRWPSTFGVFSRLSGRAGTLATRLERDREEAPARLALWKEAVSSLPERSWETLPPMEVVSLAMGHFGPARQAVALPVIAPFLVGGAASFAATTPGRGSIGGVAAHVVQIFEPAFAQIASTSARAIEELGRRANRPDPFTLPIRGYLPLLGGRLV